MLNPEKLRERVGDRPEAFLLHPAALQRIPQLSANEADAAAVSVMQRDIHAVGVPHAHRRVNSNGCAETGSQQARRETADTAESRMARIKPETALPGQGEVKIQSQRCRC